MPSEHTKSIQTQRATRTAVTNSIPLVQFRDLRALSYLSFMAAVSGHEAQLQKGMKGLDMAGWLHGSRAGHESVAIKHTKLCT